MRGHSNEPNLAGGIAAAVADRQHCKAVLKGILRKFAILKEDFGADYLTFIEGNSAVSLFGAMVLSCVPSAFLVSVDDRGAMRLVSDAMPSKSSCLVLVVDLIARPVDLEALRDGLSSFTGSTVVGAIVFASPDQAAGLVSQWSSEHFRVEVITWRPRTPSERTPSGGSREVRNWSGLREEPRGDAVTIRTEKGKSEVAPGYYTAATLPAPGPGAVAFLQRVDERIRRQELAKSEVGGRARGLKSSATQVDFSDQPAVRLELRDVADVRRKKR